MVQNPPPGFPRLTVYLLYRDLESALGFLRRAFGFEETMRIPGPGGAPSHAEMKTGDAVLMLGCPGAGYRNPKDLGQHTHYTHVYVDGVDAHCVRARAAGAKILDEPADQPYGDRRYLAEDPEGHRWAFAEHVRDVSPEEMGACS